MPSTNPPTNGNGNGHKKAALPLPSSANGNGKRSLDWYKKERLATPLGLQDAFRLIALECGLDDPIGVSQDIGREVYPHAARIVTMLRDTHDDLGLIAELEAATDAMYPDHDEGPAHESPGLSRESSFWVGYAVCWLLMQSVNGKSL